MERLRRSRNSTALLRAALLLSIAVAAGCTNVDEKTRGLYKYSGTDSPEGVAPGGPQQQVRREPALSPEKDKAMSDFVQYIKRRAEQERERAVQIRARDKQWASVGRRPSFWRRVYSFPLLFTGLSAATGALIGSTRGDAWEGALIGGGIGTLFDAARAGRGTYPFGGGMILGTGIGAAVGSRSGNTVGGLIIGAGAGLVLDSLIAAETARHPYE